MPSAKSLADARATVLDPARVQLHPALIRDAWAQLKAASGHPVQRPELLQPAYVISQELSPIQPGSDFVAIARVCERVRIKVQRDIQEGRVNPRGVA